MMKPAFSLKRLSEREISQFIKSGFVLVRQLFPSKLAEKILPRLWASLNIDPDNPVTWTKSHIHLEKVLYDEPIAEIFTRRYLEAVEDLCGPQRWNGDKGIGYWPLALPSTDGRQWQPLLNAWHLDSNSDHRHLNSPKLGLIAFHLFSDIAPGGGGTAVRIGSHRYTARILANAGPEGIPRRQLSRQAAVATNHLPFWETIGQTGDVLFIHPLTVHAASINTSTKVRIIGHKLFHLQEPMNFDRENPKDYSPVELSILSALNE